VAEHLGAPWEVASALEEYSREASRFTACYEALRHLPPELRPKLLPRQRTSAQSAVAVGAFPHNESSSLNRAAKQLRSPKGDPERQQATEAALGTEVFGCGLGGLYAASSARRACTADVRG
jgi:hypothetical protein